MDFAAIISAVEASAIADWMRHSLKAMPIVEAIHVLCAATVFGTVFIVDLRLLGHPNRIRPVTVVSSEMLRFTWSAFAVAVVTGALMFAPNAHTYVGNTAFRIKMLLLIAAGVNMLVFQKLTYRTVAAWDKDHHAPTAARVAGALSILIWITVIFVARWIGFTKGYNFDVPEDVNFSFE